MPSAVSEPSWEQKYGIQKEIHNRNTTESPRARRTSLFSPTPPPPPLGGRRFTKETALAINMGWNERDLQNRCSGGGRVGESCRGSKINPARVPARSPSPATKHQGFGPIWATLGQSPLSGVSRPCHLHPAHPPLHHLPWPQHSGHCPPAAHPSAQ